MKIKVPREVADAIEFQLGRLGGDIDALIVKHAQRVSGQGKFLYRSALLYELTTTQLATALINGYEVEETRDEKISKYYKHLDFLVPHQAGPFMKQAVEELVEIIGLEIVGIPRSKRSRNSENFRKEYGIEGVDA